MNLPRWFSAGLCIAAALFVLALVWPYASEQREMLNARPTAGTR